MLDERLCAERCAQTHPNTGPLAHAKRLVDLAVLPEPSYVPTLRVFGDLPEELDRLGLVAGPIGGHLTQFLRRRANRSLAAATELAAHGVELAQFEGYTPARKSVRAVARSGLPSAGRCLAPHVCMSLAWRQAAPGTPSASCAPWASPHFMP